MDHPQKTLASRFAPALAQAFGDEWASTDPIVRRGQHADFQADVALGLARKLGKKPREVAEALVAKLDLSGLASKVEIAGPGFLNIELDAAYLSKAAQALAADPKLGLAPPKTRENVVIDYSAPNVAKEMHVGNMRSTIIGDSLSRVFEALGHNVIRQNHLGDWGTPFGMLIEHLIDLGGDSSALTVKDLDTFYKEARVKFDGDPAFAERSRLRVVALQGGDEATLGLWRRLVDESTKYFAKVYDRLGVKLQAKDIAGESLYNPMLHDVVKDLRAAGLIKDSDGAACVFPAGFKNKEGEPLPVIVQKQDGGFGYAATDLAGLRYRLGTLKANRILYVVGATQQQHFAMVFAVAKEAGWLTDANNVVHVGFGSVLGPDKKMFKTRAGGAVKLIELIDEAWQRATALVAEKQAQNPEPLSTKEQEDIGRMVGLGAVKYADLSSDRVKDYIFDWNRMLAFDGNTAPYIQYAHARTRSIFRKVDAADQKTDPSAIAVTAPEERTLVLELLGFARAVEDVAETLQPHRLCTYLFNLATAFTAFWEGCPVLKAEPEVRRSRLALTTLTGEVLRQGLDLLGIEAPNRM